MTNRSSSAFGIFVVSLSFLALPVVGCGKDQAPPPAQTAPPAGTAQNATRLQIGMTSAQVQQIMGAPGQIKQEEQELEWKYFTPQGGKVEVKMINGLVTAIEKE